MSFLFAPAAGRGTLPPPAGGESPAEVQRKTLRPDRANTLTQFAYPGQPVLKKLPPRSGEHACGSSSAPLDFTLISYYTEKAKYVVTTTKQEEI